MGIRRAGGAVTGVCVVSLVVIISVGMAIFCLTEILGGARELQHAADAGNLAVARDSLVKPAVNGDGLGKLRETVGDEAQFIGVADDGSIYLNNINRVYAQSLIVAANAKAMQLEGTNISTTVTNAQRVEDAAEKISDQLAQQLGVMTNLMDTFLGTGNSNSTRMLRPTDRDQAQVRQEKHEVAFMNRRGCSNVNLLDEQIALPLRTSYVRNMKSQWTTAVNTGNGTGHYFQGYLDGIRFLDRDIHFVPVKDRLPSDPENVSFRRRFLTGQPHLVNLTDFRASQNPMALDSARGIQPIRTWRNPVPNAFYSCSNAVDYKSMKLLRLASCSLTNSVSPQTGYIAAIPRGFIRIKNVGGCVVGGRAKVGRTGADALSFLMSHPLYGTTLSNGEIVFAENPNDIEQPFLMATNQAPYNPSVATNMSHVNPPQTNYQLFQHCASSAIDNWSYSQIPQSWKDAINRLYGPFNQNTGTSDVQPDDSCLHALEAANWDLLVQRSNGADPAILHGYHSGMGANAAYRAPLPELKTSVGNFVEDGGTLWQLLKDSGPLLARIDQRLKEIDPSYRSSDLQQILSGGRITMSAGDDEAFIYFDSTAKKLVARPKSQIPAWLRAVRATPVDGRVGAFKVQTVGVVDSSINVAGDWGFFHPYDGPAPVRLFNRYQFTPCTGYAGLLGEVILESAFCVQSTPTQQGDAATGGTITVPDVCKFNNRGGDWYGPC